MRILILGGEGGLPPCISLLWGMMLGLWTNYLRRDLMRNEDVGPLYPILNLDERIRVWKEVSGREIERYIGDLKVMEQVVKYRDRIEAHKIFRGTKWA